MNKDFLSQEEIDALLTNGSGKKELNPDNYISMFDRDALGEIGNISFGTAATTLSTLLQQKVNITTPTVTLLHREDFGEDFPIPHVVARVEYVEGLVGSNILAIRVDDAQVIADLMLGGDGLAPAAELNDLHISAVAEAMNQMMGSASTSMATLLNRPVNISPPSVKIVGADSDPHDLITPDGEILVKISFQLQVGTLIDSHIMQMLSIKFATSLVEMLMGANDHPASGASVAADDPATVDEASGYYSSTQKNVERKQNEPMVAMAVAAYAQAQGSMAAEVRDGSHGDMGSAMAEQARVPEPPAKSARHSAQSAPPAVERAAFSAFENVPKTKGGRNLDLLLDIPLGITVELGRTKRLIRDILDLATGSIVELDTLAGEPVDILVNNKLIARGEVVVIDENFGVRVTDILSPAERIKRLQ